ncbi:hypothetical protein QOT17_000138 [Balamuthia mandrillaris]
MAQEEYPKELMRHLAALSHEKNDYCAMIKEWTFLRVEDRGRCDGECPCGKHGLRYYCYVTNTKTYKQTHVGTECIKWFEEKLASVVKTFKSLMKDGLQGQYVGTTIGGLPQFVIHANCGIVQNRDVLNGYFPGGIPVWNAGKKYRLKTQMFQGMESLVNQRNYLVRILARVSRNGSQSLIFEVLVFIFVQKFRSEVQ